MIEPKKIKLFENAIKRLFYVGDAGRWVALVDGEGRPTLLFEVIKPNDRDYIKENYGYDVDSHLDVEPKRNLLLIMRCEPDELLRVFERGSDFSLAQIPELEGFYLASNDIYLRGMGLRWNKQTSFGVLYSLGLLGLGFLLSRLL